ncbi:hypothetical protein T12_11618 [Trichinella patagoniensis]|uniref:Uncharacterized protein n=1 Tax=Trichinella patagoniensis TaxID=990121 RepID=A0A0V1AHJ0_9BILA|nr:hypothetical protein T12_11618 [Trichinella patagoniensis]
MSNCTNNLCKYNSWDSRMKNPSAQNLKINNRIVGQMLEFLSFALHFTKAHGSFCSVIARIAWQLIVNMYNV